MKKLSKIQESIWGDVRNRVNGDSIRKEDEANETEISWLKDNLNTFAMKIVYFEKYTNTADGFIKFMKDDMFRLRGCDETFTKLMYYTKKNWTVGEKIEQTIKQFIDDEWKKINATGFKKDPQKTIDQTLDDWWYSCDSDKKDDIVIYLYGYNASLGNYPDDDIYNETWDNTFWKDKIKAYNKFHNI